MQVQRSTKCNERQKKMEEMCQRKLRALELIMILNSLRVSEFSKDKSPGSTKMKVVVPTNFLPSAQAAVIKQVSSFQN